jgi:hypothetical protein
MTAAPHTWLNDHLGRWVEARIVTAQQAAEIRTFEHVTPDPAVSVVPVSAEVGVYVGSVVAVVGGAAVVSRSWDTLGVAGQAALGAVLSALAFAAAQRLGRLEGQGATRMVSFMWLVGTAGLALSVGAVAARAVRDEPGWQSLTIGVPVLAVSVVLWHNVDRPLQILSSTVGAGLALGGSGSVMGMSPTVGGVVVWFLAVGTGGAAIADRLKPERYVLASAAVGAFIGAVMTTDASQVAGLLFALVTGGVVVTVGSIRRVMPVVVIGVIELLQATQGLLSEVFEGPLASLMVAVAGLVIVVVVLLRVLTRGSPRHD